MDNTCSTYLYTKIRPHLKVLHLFFFIHLLLFAVADNSRFPYRVENIVLACGSPDNFVSEDGRNVIGDNKSQYFSLLQAQNNASISAHTPHQPSSSSEKFYLTARLSYSPFTYIFNLTAGQKFVRLYFCPTSYPNVHSSKPSFSVKANSFTLLRNFSASQTAAYGRDTISKEYCINLDEGVLNITFTPIPEAYAFINGIEIVSMPSNLYYTGGKNIPLKFLGQMNSYSITSDNALETVYRIDVAGRSHSSSEDTTMYRNWLVDDEYLTDARPGVKVVNLTINIVYDPIPNYTAPDTVYKTAMSMGESREDNYNYNLTWEFPVDSGFVYFVRLHFCEIQIEIRDFYISNRRFEIYIANQTAETQADIIAWSGGNGFAVYRDYAVLIGNNGNQKRQNLSIALHPAPRWMTNYSDALLNGLEIFKVDSDRNLAGPNLDAPPIPPSSPKQGPPTNKHTSIIVIVVGVASGFMILSLLILFIFRRARKARDSGSGASFSGHFSISTTKSTKSRGSSLPSNLCTHFSLPQIRAATNNFDDLFIIGVGGFGNVYKGYLNNGSTPVAIKRLNPESRQGALEFNTEIEMLSQLRHLHLVSLIGYCNDHGEMILVYDYMSHGTLHDQLYNGDNPPLPWNQRLEICIGAASGLNYLHRGAKHVIIHRDVKTTNILLDEKWVAKVSDFGLSKMAPTTMSKTHVSTVVKGSIGYLDPEYYRLQQLTEKSDVYSFGVVLFEVLCARPPILRTKDRKQVSLAVWAQQCYRNGTLDQIIDPYLKGKIAPECLKKFAKVAMSCLDDNGINRPSMSEVVWSLEFALQLQHTAEENEKRGGDDEGRKKDHVDDEEEDEQIGLKKFASDIDRNVMFSNIGEHVWESKTISTVSLTSSDDPSYSSKSSESRNKSGAVFSEIMNPQGR